MIDDVASYALGRLVAAQLTAGEGVRFFVYDDATGKPITKGSVVLGNPTVGIGRSLNIEGITAEEAEFLLSDDEAKDIPATMAAIPGFAGLAVPRQGVLVEMAFNMGIGGVLEFRGMLAAIARGDFYGAGEAMLESAWATQVGERAKMLATQMVSGVVAS